MKKVFKVMLIVLAVCLAVCVFSACGEPAHTHDYKTLKYDTENHWFECDCKEKSNVTAHSIVNNVCACGYQVAHTHNYATLKYDENNHWYECTCGDKKDIENHKGDTATETQKAVCSVCSQEYGTILGHTHSFIQKVITQNYLKEFATCGEKAKYYYSCECGAKGENSFEYGSALEHSFTIYYSDKNATYTSDGTKTAKCDHGCGETDTIPDIGSMLVENEIRFNTLSVDGTNVYGKVSNDTTEYVFYNEITASGTATYVVDNDKDCSSPIKSKTVDLVVGDNVFYVLESVGEDVKLYTVTIRRRPLYTVAFNTNGGTSVSSQVIEESFLVNKPTTTREGYDFVNWDYDFTKPITGNRTVNASWSAHTNTPYTVEYYLQNLADDNYAKVLTENKTGTTDTTANAEIKTYEHFTYNDYKSNVSGNIDGNGGKVLKVYYTRDKYEVKFLANGGTKTSGSATQYIKYQGSATAPTYARECYTFDGFDKEFTNISQDTEVTAKWIANEYTVTLNVNGGNALSQTTQRVNYDSEYTLSIPTRANCDFLGWFNGSTQITDEKGKGLSKWTFSTDLEFKAKWQARIPFTTETYTRDGQYVYFGRYPQTIKDSTVTISDTTTKDGYYYLGSDNEYYVKVVANPCGSSYKFSSGETVYNGSAYYFKVEPIKWRILSETNGEAFVLCESIIANSEYDASHSNNYANSDIRAWLNETFLNTAFNKLQQDLIKTTTVDNSARSTFPNNNATQWNNGENSWACSDTQDKIFLLSMQEATNSAYGFNADVFADDIARRKNTTDYSRATGVEMCTRLDYYANSAWWLRSPYHLSLNSNLSWFVDFDGSANHGSSVHRADFGVVPALQIQF